MSGIVIDLQVTDKSADTALDRLDSVLAKLQTTQERFIESLKATSQWANQSASSFNKMAQGASRASTASQRVTQGQKRVSAYYSAIASTDPGAALRFAQGQLAADPYDAAAIRLRNRAQGVLNRQNPANGLQSALARTRFTPGGAGLPLGFDLMKYGPQLFGTGMQGMGHGVGGAASAFAGAGAAGAVIGGVITSLAAFASAVKNTAEYISSVGRSMAAGGSIQGLESYAGVGGFGSAAGGARTLQGAIQSGFGASFASQAGINIVGGAGGDIDYGEKLRKALRFIAGSKSFDQARRRAEGLGLPEAANLYNTSNFIKQNIGKPVQPLSMADVRAATDFTAALSRLAELFKGRAAKTLTYWLEETAVRITFVTNALEAFFNWLDNIYKWVADKLGIKTNGQSAQEKNTKAIDDNTRALHDFRETLGGGPRAQNAVPQGLHGANFGNARNMRLGVI